MSQQPPDWSTQTEKTANTGAVMYYETRDVFRWMSATSTALFAVIVIGMILVATGVAGGDGSGPNAFTDMLAPFGALPDLTDPTVGGAGALFTAVATVVFAPLAWSLGRAMHSVPSPAAHCLAFGGLGAFFALAPTAALGIIGGGISGLSILLNPVCWVVAMVFAGASVFGWAWAYRRRDEPLDLRWWEQLVGGWYFTFRRR